MSAREQERRAVLALQAGDEDGFRFLYEQHNLALRKLACWLGVTPLWRDDVVQETWRRVTEAAARLDAARPVRPWLRAVLLNVVREYRRKYFSARVRRLAERDEERAEELGRAGPGWPLWGGVSASGMWRVIARLRPAQAAAFVAHEGEGATFAEAGEELARNPHTVASDVRRARLALQRLLGIGGASTPAPACN
jgi:RNA polymerase sigma factor (sigma-70 family)